MDCKLVVGIYGVSGCGKSRLLAILQESRPEWRCIEGSQVIGMIMQEQGESMKDFYEKSETEKELIRRGAVEAIRGFSGVTIVAGHCSFPTEETTESISSEIEFNDVFTSSDGETYDAILYLDKEASTVYMQREGDNETTKRSRPSFSSEVLQEWIEHEKRVLQSECEKYGIPFSAISDDDTVEAYISEQFLAPLVSQMQAQSEHSLKQAIRSVPPADVFLLIDGDRTLCPDDTGKLFVDKVVGNDQDPIKGIFKRHESYTFQAFLEVAMFYARILPVQDYEHVSSRIGRKDVAPYSQWIHFLTVLPQNVHAIVLTSGNRELWMSCLEANMLDSVTTLIAGNHIGIHSYIVDSNAKATVVKELRNICKGCKVISFGDSAVDIPMMRVSDEAYIVIDDRKNRSMQAYIRETVELGNSNYLRQLNFLAVEAGDSLFLHDGIRIGSLACMKSSLIDSNFHQVVDCASTSTAAKLLASQSRRADLNGPALQDVHVQIGIFLADKLLDEVGRLGLLVDSTSFFHVQGTAFEGMVSSPNLVILPLMRGGEPMSRGVYQRFPHAKLIHYDDKETGTKSVLISTLDSGCINDVIIVDSVVNEGNSVRRTIASLKNYDVRLYVLSAVMQREASIELPREFPRVRFISLRVSDNKYTGRGGTDTGNRLFGTL